MGTDVHVYYRVSTSTRWPPQLGRLSTVNRRLWMMIFRSTCQTVRFGYRAEWLLSAVKTARPSYYMRPCSRLYVVVEGALSTSAVEELHNATLTQ